MEDGNQFGLDFGIGPVTNFDKHEKTYLLFDLDDGPCLHGKRPSKRRD